MNITKGPVKTAIRVGIYGTEGVGKTTFASRFPGAVFIDTEGSTKHLDVARFDPPATLKDVFDQLTHVIAHPDQIGTVVIDTVDWLERLIFRAVCEEKHIENIEDIGYGKGYVYAKQKLQQLLDHLDRVIEQGINVVLVCHSMIRKFELPDEMGSYDRYTLKLNEKNIAPLVKEWVDMLLFVNYKTDIVTDSDGKTKKGRGGQKRIMYANHSACWDAKNRFGLPDEMPFDFAEIAHLFTGHEPVQPAEIPAPEKKKPPKPASVKKADKVPEPTAPDRPEAMRSEDPDKDKLLDRLWGLMVADKLTDPALIRAVVAEKGYYDLTTEIRDYETDFIDGCLIEAWPTVSNLALSKQYGLPF